MGIAPGPIKHYDVTEYFALAECGVLSPDDRVELLDGLVVAMAPQAPLHAAVIYDVHELLRRRLPPETVVRVRSPFIAGRQSAPEPDIAVLPGVAAEYRKRHPDRAFLVIEVADSSVAQDRLTKAHIYAAAAVPEYWLINLRDGCVERFWEPDVAVACYASSERVYGSGRVCASSLPDLVVLASELVDE